MTSVTTDTRLIHKHIASTATTVDTSAVQQPPLSDEAKMALAPLATKISGDQSARPVVVTPPANFPTAKELEEADITAAMVLGALVSFLESDADYAYSWQCSIAQCIRNEGIEPYKANRAAATFLSMLTSGKVDMTKNELYIGLIKSYDKQLAALGIEEAKEKLHAGNKAPIEIEDGAASA